MKKGTVLGMAACVLFLGILGSVPFSGAKDIFPAKPITIICGSPAGGGTDLAQRAIAAYLSEWLKAVSPGCKGGEVVVKNVPAASGMKARTTLYSEEPDGYTIGDLNTGHLYDYTLGSEKPPFDVRKFTWLFTSSYGGSVMVARKGGPKTWEEMLAAAKKEPLRWLAGSYGGSIHIEAIWIKEVVGIEAKLLQVQGASGIISGMIRGDGDVAYLPVDSAKSIIETKDVNVLVSFTKDRIFPDIPTIVEKGYPQFMPYIESPRIIMGPPNLDPEAKRIVIEAAKKLYVDPKYVEHLKKMGARVMPIVGDDLEKLVNGYINLYKELEPILKKNMKYS